MEIVKCQNCGIDIENQSGRRKYCSKCRKIMDRKLRKINDEKKKLLRKLEKKNKDLKKELDQTRKIGIELCKRDNNLYYKNK